MTGTMRVAEARGTVRSLPGNPLSRFASTVKVPGSL